MTTLLLPFGIRLCDGEIVSASDVPRGAACGCICPGCHQALVAKQGTEREWHFAHAKACNCADGYEKSVHSLAKQRIKQRLTLLLPTLDAQSLEYDAFHAPVIERAHVMDSRHIRLDSCETSLPHGVVTPDMIGRVGGHPVLVEIVVFHQLSIDKKERLMATGVPSFLIDLSKFQTVQATKEALDFELFDNPSNRHWIWHPKLEEAQKSVDAKVRSRIDAAQARWEIEMATRSSVRRYTRTSARTVAHQPEPPRIDEDVSPLLGRRWRARLPDLGSIEAAAGRFAERVHRPPDEILRLSVAITSRGMLVDVTPKDVASEWARSLGVERWDVEFFLVDADYVL